VQQRVAELNERSHDGSALAEEQSELEDYLQLEHIMIMAKARARQTHGLPTDINESLRRFVFAASNRSHRKP
jgi:hypothetical protein